MKPFLLMLLLTAAIPLRADEPKAEQPKSAGESPAAESTAGDADSPMVRAARRANRLGRKPATVITNESVKKSKGHITTTTVQRPIEIPRPAMASDEAAALRKRETAREQARVRVIGEEKAKQQELEALERRARAAEMAEEGYFEDAEGDPARTEGKAEETSRNDATKPDSNPAAGQKPPQG